MPSAFRPPAPAAQALVRWPEAFGTRFALFVDTEEEFDWTAPFRRDGHGTTAVAALPQAHRRFAEREIGVFYLVDYPVAANPAAAAVLREVLADGRSEIGAQLHPWVTPPFDEQLSTFNSFAGNLPEPLEGAKLDQLGQAIKDAVGQAPRIYRAGRYGLGPHSLKLLYARGYRIDASMRPAFSYAGEGGPDYRAIGNHAFRTGPDDALLELPFTTVFTGWARAAGSRLHAPLQRLPKAAGAASRLGLLNRVALTPEGVPVDEVREAIRTAVGEGIRLLNFSFHSPSLMPGHTPYVRDAGDLRRFWTWWEGVFDLLDRLGVRPASLDEILAAAS
ncbi:polysaccharide deacetylase family protein [Sphingomonas sp. PL-96]|uniref:polysaccharide deacetylase family protein n=1 Tax=Sphingomonas sp. PL-96 TaxID=2887201 RepID=UPI001E62963B|nr:polysaccharide deacetylase family protein [Sphingomonas sp. PL-96]MCC2976725.1 polysaccharide deacetylase family protein [Sphingomonas sp. PL-96]